MFCIESLKRNEEYIYWIDIPSSDENAPFILFSHGFPDNGFGWKKQIEFFNDSFKNQFYMVAPFMHGSINQVKVSMSRIHTDELLKDINLMINYIDPKKKRKIYLVGHDLGAFLSIAYYDMIPERIKGIVHLNGMGLQQYSHRKYSFRQWIKSYYVILVQFAPMRFLIQHVFPRQFLNLIYKLSKVDKNDPLFQNDQNLFTNLTQYKMLLRRTFYYLGMKISKIKAPTLFVWGHEDCFLNHPTLLEVNKFYYNAEIRIIEGGHWVHSSSTDHVNRILKKIFLRWQGKKISTNISRNNINMNKFKSDRYHLLNYCILHFCFFLMISIYMLIYRDNIFTLDFKSYHLILFILSFFLWGLPSSLLHNCAHKNIKPKFLNNVTGEIIGAFMLYGFKGFRLGHLYHHKYPDDPIWDPHPPKDHSFIQFVVAPVKDTLMVIERGYFQNFGKNRQTEFDIKIQRFLFYISGLSRLFFWICLFKLSGFLSIYLPIYIGNIIIFAHINYATHVVREDGSCEIINLNHNLYYRLVNAISFNGYFHKFHHMRPQLFDPKSAKLDNSVKYTSYKY